jgi:MarR family 2-MHQ and catechol resistance regulon transcriptional repressor
VNGDPIGAPELWLVLAKCYRAISKRVESSIEALGLGLSDFMALEALYHKGPLTISEIQGKVLLASGSMTAAVDRLEEQGWVLRTSSAKDRRARVLELTPEGRRVIKAAYKEHTRDLGEAMSVLSEADKEVLYKQLRKLGRFAARLK